MSVRRPYKDLSAGSGVRYFEPGPGFIRLWFVDGRGYEYDEMKPGRRHVDAMKRRAEGGKGLATYVSQHVKKKYARKL
jgi:hypothetical protein